MNLGTNWFDLWGTLLEGLSESSTSKVICPTCGHYMITLHGGHYHCEDCGGQITEDDL